jgi:thiazole synthase ThiGH ThiG subunit
MGTKLAEKTTWWKQRWIQVGEYQVNSFWHCFGNHTHKVDLDTAVQMIKASETSLLPINTHKLKENVSRDSFLIGHGDVTLEKFEAAFDTSNLVKTLNINLQTTAEDAVKHAVIGKALTGINLLKLEVLTENMRESNDEELLKAVKKLVDLGGFVIMPLISANYEVAKKLVEEYKCPLLRVMGSNIGSGEGIKNKEEIKKIASLGVPVILDGGIGSVEDFMTGIELGLQGGLINSMLFFDGKPVDAMKSFVEKLSEYKNPFKNLQ